MSRWIKCTWCTLGATRASLQTQTSEFKCAILPSVALLIKESATCVTKFQNRCAKTRRFYSNEKGQLRVLLFANKTILLRKSGLLKEKNSRHTHFLFRYMYP